MKSDDALSDCAAAMDAWKRREFERQVYQSEIRPGVSRVRHIGL